MAIFEAIGSLVGGLLNNRAADKRQAQMLDWQERMDNTKIQRTQKDAKEAGVHPLAAMGASLTSPSPVTVGGHSDYSDMGQNVGRALDATMSSGEKVDDYTKAVQALNIEKMALDNEVVKTQLANAAVRTVNQAGNPPPFVDGRGDLVDGMVYQVPGKPSRREVQEHNRWNEDGWKRPPGPTGEDWENEIGDVSSNIPSTIRAMRMLALNFPQFYYNSAIKYHRARRAARQARYEKQWNDASPSSGW